MKRIKQDYKDGTCFKMKKKKLTTRCIPTRIIQITFPQKIRSISLLLLLVVRSWKIPNERIVSIGPSLDTLSNNYNICSV
jgi:hypothetical protein